MFLTDSQPGYILSMFLKFCLISAWTFLKEKECLLPKQQSYSDLIHLSRKSVVEFWSNINSWYSLGFDMFHTVLLIGRYRSKRNPVPTGEALKRKTYHKPSL